MTQTDSPSIDVPEPRIRTGPSSDKSRLRRFAEALDHRFFALAVLPAFLAVFAATIIPFLAGIGLSFSSVTSTHTGVFPATLNNYRRVGNDPEARTVLGNTIEFTVSAVVLEMVLGLALALLLAHAGKIIRVFRVIFLFPLTVAGIVAATSWSALLNTTQGWINYYLGVLHLPQPDWLASSAMAMPTVVIVDLWSGVPIVSVLVLAALLGLPQEPIEAAMIDGASSWQRFRYITVPAIVPVLALAAMLRFVAAFQQFALFQALTGGGPGLRTTVLNNYVYKQSFVFNNIGYGAALAIIMIVLMAVPLLILFYLSRRR